MAIKIQCTIRGDEDENKKLIVVNSRCGTVARLQLQRVILRVTERFSLRNSSIALRWREGEKHGWTSLNSRNCLIDSKLIALSSNRAAPAPIVHQNQSRITLRRRLSSESCLNFGQARNTSRDISLASVTALNSFITMQTSYCLSWNVRWYRLECPYNGDCNRFCNGMVSNHDSSGYFAVVLSFRMRFFLHL